MHSQIWVVSTLLISIVLIVLTIVKFKFHPFLALLLASFFVGTMMGMGPLDMVNAIESGIGGTLGFLAAVIGLGTILGKMMEVPAITPSFYHHPTPFAVNGGFANQTKTVSKIKAIAAIRKISFAEIESDCWVISLLISLRTPESEP